MEKILSKKQQATINRKESVPVEYKALRKAGTKSWTAVDHLAEKHGVSNATIYRDLVKSGVVLSEEGK